MSDSLQSLTLEVQEATSAQDRYRARQKFRQYQDLLARLARRQACPKCGFLCQVCHQNKRCCLA